MIEKRLLFGRGRRVNKPVLIAISMICIVVASCLIAAVSAGPPEKTPVIIGFKEKPDPDLIRAHGGEIKYKYHIIPAIAASLPEQAIDALKRNPNIEYIEPDYEVTIAAEVLPWGIDRTDADLVWNGTQGGQDVVLGRNAGDGIKIAIIDTGIGYTHPDLANNVKGGHRFLERGAINDSNYMDDHGHGTFCAGIAAPEDNDIGVIGVAPKAHLYGVKTFNSRGVGSTSDIIASIEWSTDNGMNVISMSFGSHENSWAVRDACNEAYSAGIVLVGAAANANESVWYPAAHDSVIAVGATDSNDVRASFSNFGPKLELMAPGVGIYSTYLGGGYETLGGTSASCPHVSGTAALVFASDVDAAYDFDDDEVWDANEIRKKLQDTADDFGDPGWDEYYGYGLVDAYEAANNMYISNITMSIQFKGVHTRATATVTVVNANNDPLEGATVYGHWSGLTSDTDSGVTDANGQTTLVSDWVKKVETGTFTFTVDNVTKEGWTYDPLANNETTDSITF